MANYGCPNPKNGYWILTAAKAERVRSDQLFICPGYIK